MGQLGRCVGLCGYPPEIPARRPEYRAEDSLWRYLPLLPVAGPGWRGNPASVRLAGRLLSSWSVWRRNLGLEHLWLKDESRNPLPLLKDRAVGSGGSARPVISIAETIVTASTGNAGAALAGMSAAVGQKAVIFAPKSAPPAQVAQLLVYGAKVILVMAATTICFLT